MGREKLILEIIRFVCTRDGCDKVTRCTQYFCQFVSALLVTASQRKNMNQSMYYSLSNKLDSISFQMYLARKLFRWGRPLAHLINIIKEIQKYDKKNKTKSILFILREATKMVSIVFDHILWICIIGLYERTGFQRKMEITSSIFQLMSSLFKIAIDLKEQRSIKKIGTIKEILDVPVCLGYMSKRIISSRVQGLFGTLSAFIGLREKFEVMKNQK